MDIATYDNGKIWGKCTVFKENGKVVCTYTCPFEEHKVVRLFLRTDSEVIPLGVMLPGGGQFALRKNLSANLAGGDGEKIISAYVERRIIGSHNTPPLSFHFEKFQPLRQPLITADHALQNCTQQPCGLLWCQQEEITYLAAPLMPKTPFGLAAFFCLATPVTYENTLYGVIQLNEENIPNYLHKTAE